jgi:type IV pilus assembly protein PilC
MIYPAFIFTTLIAISLLLVTFVIPRLTPILKGAGAELPFSTNLLIVVSNAFLKFWWLLIPFIIISSGGLFTYFKRTVEGNRVWDGIKLKIPIAGKIIRNIYMARFTRTFSTLIDGGVNVIDALEITADSIGNVHYEKDLLNISKEVKNGSSLADSFRKSHYTSRVVKKMMKVGETTGTLDTTIAKLADFYEAEVEDSINNLSKTLEPVLIVIMGVGVAFVVSSVIMPLYDATRSLGSN